MVKEKSFSQLESEWYHRLEKEGFQDIEDTKNKNRPLKDWHSWKLVSKRFQIIQESKSEYQQQIDRFLNSQSFLDACTTLRVHGNSKLTVIQIQLIWEMHTNGLPVRKIARAVGRSKSIVQDMIRDLREWMKLM